MLDHKLVLNHVNRQRDLQAEADHERLVVEYKNQKRFRNLHRHLSDAARNLAE